MKTQTIELCFCWQQIALMQMSFKLLEIKIAIQSFDKVLQSCTL